MEKTTAVKERPFIVRTGRTEKLEASMEVEKEQVPGEDFVFVDAVFGMTPEQVGLQEEEDKKKPEYTSYIPLQ